jgi:hypothetical protein
MDLPVEEDKRCGKPLGLSHGFPFLQFLQGVAVGLVVDQDGTECRGLSVQLSRVGRLRGQSLVLRSPRAKSGPSSGVGFVRSPLAKSGPSGALLLGHPSDLLPEDRQLSLSLSLSLYLVSDRPRRRAMHVPGLVLFDHSSAGSVSPASISPSSRTTCRRASGYIVSMSMISAKSWPSCRGSAPNVG